MAFNLIVLAVTLLVGGFVLVWALFPRVRPWMEAPKYRVLDWEKRFPGVEPRDARQSAEANPPLTAGLYTLGLSDPALTPGRPSHRRTD